MKRWLLKSISVMTIAVLLLPTIAYMENSVNDECTDLGQPFEDTVVAATENDPVPEELGDLDLPLEDELTVTFSDHVENMDTQMMDPNQLDDTSEDEEPSQGNLGTEQPQESADQQEPNDVEHYSDIPQVEATSKDVEASPEEIEDGAETKESDGNANDIIALTEASEGFSESTTSNAVESLDIEDADSLLASAEPTIITNAIDSSEKPMSMEADNDGRTVNFTKSASITCNLGESIWLHYNGKDDTHYIKSADIYNRRIVSDGEIDYNSVHLKMEKVGKTKIKITRTNKKKYTIRIKVVDPNEPTSIEIWQYKERIKKKGTITLPVGSTEQLYGYQYQRGKLIDNTQPVTWKSSRSSIVSINSNGQIAAKKAGKAKISAKTYNGKKTYIYVKVVRNKLDNINKKPNSRTIKRQYNNRCDVLLKSVEFSNENLIIEAYAINGTNKKTNIYGGNMTLSANYYGNIANGAFTARNVKAHGCKLVTLSLGPGYSDKASTYDQEKVNNSDLDVLCRFNNNHYGFTFTGYIRSDNDNEFPNGSVNEAYNTGFTAFFDRYAENEIKYTQSDVHASTSYTAGWTIGTWMLTTGAVQGTIVNCSGSAKAYAEANTGSKVIKKCPRSSKLFVICTWREWALCQLTDTLFGWIPSKYVDFKPEI